MATKEDYKRATGFFKRYLWFVLVGGVVLAAVVMMLVMKRGNNEQAMPASAAPAFDVSRGGSGQTVANPLQQKLVDDANKQGAASAVQGGGTFVPSFDVTAPPVAAETPGHGAAPAVEQGAPGANGNIRPPATAYQQPAYQPPPPQQLPAPMSMNGGLDKQFTLLQAVWKNSLPVTVSAMPSQAQAQGAPSGLMPAQGLQQAVYASQTAPATETLVEMYDMDFAVLDSAINTDETPDVMATVTTGKYEGSRLFGRVQRVNEVVRVTFQGQKFPDGKGRTINAIAADEMSAKTALKGEVDHKYFSRYGFPLIAGILSNYGDAIATRNGVTTVTTQPGIVQSTAPLNHSQIVKLALGKGVGSMANTIKSTAAAEQIAVKIPAGTPIAVIYMQEVKQ